MHDGSAKSVVTRNAVPAGVLGTVVIASMHVYVVLWRIEIVFDDPAT